MTYIPAILRNNKIQQAPSNETIHSSQIPVSAGFGNIAEVRPDGIYVGTGLPQPTYYVAAAGTDAPTNGSKASPFKTLDYAIQHIGTVAGNIRGYSVNIALKAGESFTLTQRHELQGNVVLTFYGDPEFGDFDAPSTNVNGEYCVTLNRPVVEVSSISVPGAPVISAGFTSNYRLEFRGLKINLPTNPSGAGTSDYSLYDTVSGSVDFHLIGSIVNKQSVSSYAGILGITARTQARFSQYASQFLIMDAKANSAGAPGLAIRPHFIHFYMDARVNSAPFLFASSANSNSGYGMLSLSWTDTQVQTVGAYSVVDTFPTISDVSYGLRNYFTNLQRDQQSRPLNVQTPILF